MAEKPILFNTEMVRAILGGRKTQTRRVIKPHNPARAKLDGYKQGYGLWFSETRDNTADKWYIKDYSVSTCWISDRNYIKEFAPYKPGDTLWVKETWKNATGDLAGGGYALFDTHVYKADGKAKDDYPVDELMVEDRWRPSIHMPRAAARIFLRVTGVRAERLQNMSDKDAQEEGIGRLFLDAIAFGDKDYGCMEYIDYKGWLGMEKEQFAHLWDSTIKKSDLPLYGWDANPWVWVIEFERTDRK